MIFHWSLSDSKSNQVSRTLLGILADLNNAVIWMVSTRPLISKSSSPCTNPLVTVPKAPIIIVIIVTFMFPTFFDSLVRPRYLSPPLFFFNFTLWSSGTVKSTILPVLFFFFFFLVLLIMIRLGRLAEIRWSVCILKSQRSLVFHSQGQILDYAYTICSYGQIKIFWTIPSGSPCPPSRA